jgi:hypothetical protein
VSEVVKADKGGLHELATGQENQAAMVLRTFAEIDRQRHTYAENKQVAPENGEKRRYVLVKDSYLEAASSCPLSLPAHDHDWYLSGTGLTASPHCCTV